jgi:UTP--glucose-1-phosphate uridylyltransferase
LNNNGNPVAFASAYAIGPGGNADRATRLGPPPLPSATPRGQGAARFGRRDLVKALRKAVLPVAGLGTRFLPATKAMAKEMLPIVDKPLIQYAIEEARAAGIEQFCLITGRGKTALVEHFDVAFELEATLRQRHKQAELDMLAASRLEPGALVTVRQQEPLGLGHAIWCARAFIGDDPFAILLPDDLILSDTPCTKQLADAYYETGGSVVAVVEVPPEHTNRYGILKIGKDDGRLVEVTGLVEKPKPEDAPSNLSVIGRYVLLPDVIEHLARMERGAGNEVQLTDGMARMIGTTPFHGLRYEGRRFDCGDKIGFLEAQIAFALQRPEMAAQVRQFLHTYLETP